MKNNTITVDAKASIDAAVVKKITEHYCHAKRKHPYFCDVCSPNWLTIEQQWKSHILPWAIVGNTIIHAIVDDLKANKKRLNLVQDQLLHLAQIVITATLF